MAVKIDDIGMLEGGCEGSCEDECEGGCGEDCGLGYEDGCELGCKLGMSDGYKLVQEKKEQRMQTQGAGQTARVSTT